MDEHRTLSEELAELERTDPQVAAAAASFDRTAERIASGALDRNHAIPCVIADCPWHGERRTLADDVRDGRYDHPAP